MIGRSDCVKILPQGAESYTSNLWQVLRDLHYWTRQCQILSDLYKLRYFPMELEMMNHKAKPGRVWLCEFPFLRFELLKALTHFKWHLKIFSHAATMSATIFSKASLVEPTQIVWVFGNCFCTISWSMQFAEDCLHYFFCEVSFCRTSCSPKTAAWEEMIFYGDIEGAVWTKQDSIIRNVLTWRLIEALQMFGDYSGVIWSLMMKSVLWNGWWFMMIDSAGLK